MGLRRVDSLSVHTAQCVRAPRPFKNVLFTFKIMRTAAGLGDYSRRGCVNRGNAGG